MNDTFRKLRFFGGFQAIVMLLAVSLTMAPAADEKGKPKPEERVAVGKCVSQSGSLVVRKEGSKDWQVVKKGDALYSGDLIVQPAVDAFIDSKNGAVRLGLLADLAEISAHQALESAVVLHNPPAGVDLDFTLDRGLVDVVNRKDKGAAHVRVEFHKERWDLTLAEPGTRVALELYSRWARGVPFQPKPEPTEEPTAQLSILVLKGEADVKHARHQFALRPPPGPALLEWNSVSGEEPPRKVEKLPAWADPNAAKTPGAKKLEAAFERLTKLLTQKPVLVAMKEMLNSADPVDRRVGIIGLAAVDDLAELAEAMNNTKYVDVRGTGIIAFRQWIGRAPGQDYKLYQALLKHDFTKGQAQIVMDLLHSFGNDRLARPETYDALIAYLMHPKPAIRMLAEWHLYRLVPAGRKIKYDPAASEADRKKAQEAWEELIKELISEDKLPGGTPKPKPKKG
jgi:hypothetical protein